MPRTHATHARTCTTPPPDQVHDALEAEVVASHVYVEALHDEDRLAVALANALERLTQLVASGSTRELEVFGVLPLAGGLGRGDDGRAGGGGGQGHGAGGGGVGGPPPRAVLVKGRIDEARLATDEAGRVRVQLIEVRMRGGHCRVALPAPWPCPGGLARGGGRPGPPRAHWGPVLRPPSGHAPRLDVPAPCFAMHAARCSRPAAAAAAEAGAGPG
jgi:hypothetical protein